MYSFEQFDPRPQADNSALIGRGNLYGLEVTVPKLAEACDLGNIDPQHLGGDATRTAIEDATIVDLPNPEATLVTVRADADSVGAMAILAGRAEFGEGWLQSPDVQRGITVIAEGDKESSGNWPGRRSITEPHEMVTPFTVVNSVASDFKLTLAERVSLVQDWLDIGLFDGQYERQLQLLDEATTALSGLAVTVRSNGLAVVEGSHRLAMQLGYSEAPRIVATNPEFRFAGGEPHIKHTVARWNTNTPMDWNGAKAMLNDAENGWGGSSSIMGSPQGVSSKLKTEEVVEIIESNITDIEKRSI